jgi:hypothetical protein
MPEWRDSGSRRNFGSDSDRYGSIHSNFARLELWVAAHDAQRAAVAILSQIFVVGGPVFWKMSQGKEEIVTLRITNLNRYVESLQEK